jgi:hypothetical protein
VYILAIASPIFTVYAGTLLSHTPGEIIFDASPRTSVIVPAESLYDTKELVASIAGYLDIENIHSDPSLDAEISPL